MTSLKTKIAGLLAILTTVLPGLKTLLDNDPSTSPDWNLIVAAVVAGVGQRVNGGTQGGSCERYNTMKRLRILTMAVLIAVTPVVIVTTQTGCKTSALTIAFKTLSATALSVDTAMKAFADRVAAGKVDAPSQLKVREALVKYQAAMKAAIETAQFNFQAPTPEALSALANLLLTTISEVSQ